LLLGGSGETRLAQGGQRDAGQEKGNACFVHEYPASCLPAFHGPDAGIVLLNLYQVNRDYEVLGNWGKAAEKSVL
jgi:hypothetical protein